MSATSYTWVGRGFVEKPAARNLGHQLTRRLLELIPAERIESYGKTAAVGVAGEIEHASSMIHALRFGNVSGDAVAARPISSSAIRATRGALLCPDDAQELDGRRSHFITANFQIAEGRPSARRMAAGSTRGCRPCFRLPKADPSVRSSQQALDLNGAMGP
ncbi:amino acid synthesis family protein [Mesorhizobium sp.]|uniref:amino acid synthesis family protein n=1 Tax=Mesorhizobium sp. TaxID=1871066 RepID=UPI0025D59FF8|nr:amino acid synthesis family protein [Mesorhizobium sp.]